LSHEVSQTFTYFYLRILPPTISHNLDSVKPFKSHGKGNRVLEMKSRQKDHIFLFETNTILPINMYQIIWNKIPNKYSKFLFFSLGLQNDTFLSPHVEGINYPSKICVGKIFTLSNKTYFLFPCFQQKKKRIWKCKFCEAFYIVTKRHFPPDRKSIL
jgi:hypothetical protein